MRQFQVPAHRQVQYDHTPSGIHRDNRTKGRFQGLNPVGQINEALRQNIEISGDHPYIMANAPTPANRKIHVALSTRQICDLRR